MFIAKGVIKERDTKESEGRVGCTGLFGGIGHGFGEFDDALFGLGEVLATALDEADGLLIRRHGLLKAQFAGFDSRDDVLDLIDGLLEGWGG